MVDILNDDNLSGNECYVEIFIDFNGTQIQAKVKYHVTKVEMETM